MLSVAEVCRQEKTLGFAASLCGDSWVYAWVHKRGALDKGSSDGGQDLVVMAHGGFPQVVISGAKSLSTPSFDGPRFLVVKDGKEAVLGSATSLEVRTWLTLPAGESFEGAPTWAGDDVLFATSGGTPKRSRLHAIAAPSTDGAAGNAASRRTLFVAQHGGGIMSWDRSPVAPHHVVAVHRLANAMYAELVLLEAAAPRESALQWLTTMAGQATQPKNEPRRSFSASGAFFGRDSSGDSSLHDVLASGLKDAPQHLLTPAGQQQPAARVIARDGRVEYCKPQVGFLSDGGLVARLNLARGEAKVAGGMPRDVTHGLWRLDAKDLEADAAAGKWAPVHVCSWLGDHGSYDVCSSSYAGGHGVREGFLLDVGRETLVFSARSHDPASGMSDELVRVHMPGLVLKDGVVVPKPSNKADSAAASSVQAGKGCHVPIAFGNGSLVFHFRSPKERGDLWSADVPRPGYQAVHRTRRWLPTQMTHTMPVPLRSKLSAPEELVIGGRHALLFRPPPSKAAQPALVWAHGGPMAAFSFDFNPMPAWLASLGYVVCVPNFAGSTGFGLDVMDEVFGEGCGVADLADCVAAAEFLRGLEGVDVSRGVGIAGHSWGGYLALRALTAPAAKGAFACGVACAGIADWFCQQKGTEVRYYDYALMGGWVYEPAVAPRAKEQSPLTHAAALRAPLLVLHGEDDIDVPFAQAKAFVEAAQAARRPPDPAAPALELVSFAGEGHGMGGWKPATQADALHRMRDFLRIHLKPWDFTDNPHGDLTAY
eukprot:Transcript_13559.p1 GENE.Transcript_13559~~Transcript_13559.p1  ORF type:complete len:767 (+),score=240.76 Transcript_13559:97-2397(+)